jgi:hypothetical protein
MMRLRILCMLCCVCAYVKLFRGGFYKTSYQIFSGLGQSFFVKYN